jgi:hypothetical protein
MFDTNELEHIKAFQDGNSFETDMGHKDCLRCDVVNGKYGSSREHEFLEFNHTTGKRVPRNLGHADCPQCRAGKDYLDVHDLSNPNTEVSVGEDGSIISTYRRPKS